MNVTLTTVSLSSLGHLAAAAAVICCPQRRLQAGGGGAAPSPISSKSAMQWTFHVYEPVLVLAVASAPLTMFRALELTARASDFLRATHLSGSHTRSSQRPKLTPRLSMPLSDRASSEAYSSTPTRLPSMLSSRSVAPGPSQRVHA